MKVRHCALQRRHLSRLLLNVDRWSVQRIMPAAGV